jgi:predicted transcriptional regulator
MAEAIKFTDTEVESINQLRQDVSNVFTQLGQLEIEKERRIQEIDSIRNDLLSKHKELQKTEEELFKGLNEKYGDGNYDPSTNTFTPVEIEKETVTETEK